MSGRPRKLSASTTQPHAGRTAQFLTESSLLLLSSSDFAAAARRTVLLVACLRVVDRFVKVPWLHAWPYALATLAAGYAAAWGSVAVQVIRVMRVIRVIRVITHTPALWPIHYGRTAYLDDIVTRGRMRTYEE
jgi:hypothetical protein